jgi:hypothetical protein
MKMKFLTMVTTSNPEKAGAPPPELFDAIMKLGMSTGAALKDTGGMRDTGKVKVEGGQLVVDGPYAEAKEALGGYAIYELPTEADVIEYCSKFLDLHRKHWPVWEGEVSILQLIGMAPPTT